MEVTTVWLHLLIVDDDEMACLGLENRLRAMPFSHQMEIVSVHSGEEALEHAQRRTVDILLTDIQMAGMNGLDLIAGILKLNPQLCSVIITAYPSFPYAHQAIRLGVVDFLLKPVSRDEMRETIQKAVALVEERRKSAANRPADTANCADPVTWAKDYVHRHLSEEINMALVANQMNLSYTYFSKLFKKETGQTFTQYIVDAKMQAAADMLLAGRRTSEIALQLGYLVPQNFNRAFLNYWHCSPSEYRRLRGRRKP